MAATTPDPAVTLEPSEAGFDGERLARLDDYLDQCVANDLNKGSVVMVARGGRLLHVSRRGFRDPDAGLPFELDTICRLFSMTKPVTSVAALILFEEGLISLSDPVERFIPAFADVRVHRAGAVGGMVTEPAVEPIRIWHLLTHTAGLTVTGLFSGPVDDAYKAAGIKPLAEPESYGLEEACELLASLPLLFQPGSRWNYSHATDVLGRVIEVVTGTPLERFMADRLFAPLGMADTGFREPPRDRLATLYRLDPHTGGPVRMPNPPVAAGHLPPFVAGGHGLFSTARDYHRFVQMLARRGELDGVRILSPRTVELMTANHLPGNATMAGYGHHAARTGESLAGRGFGLGVAPLLDPIAVNSLSSRGEYGWGGAAGTNFWVDPDKDLTVLFMMHVIPPPDAIWVNLRRLVYQALVD